MTGKWFMQRDNKEYGPYDWIQLEQFAKEKRLLASDIVKEEGGSEWFPAVKIPGLFDSTLPVTPVTAIKPGPPVKKKEGSTGKLVAIIVGSVLLFVVLAIVGLVFFGMSMIRNSEPYTFAMDRLRSNQEVVSILGEPIKAKALVTGQVSVSGTSGEAEIAIPVSGPLSSGTVYVTAAKSGGRWHYEQLELASEGGKRINLLGEIISEQEGFLLFNEPGFGYQLIYPNDWHYEIRDHIVIFIGSEGNINVQTLASSAVGGGYDDFDDLFADFANQYFDMGAQELDNFEEHLFEYAGETYKDVTFSVIYQYDGDEHWSFVWLMERDQETFHAVIVTMPLEMLEHSSEVFPAILDSFTLVDFYPTPTPLAITTGIGNSFGNLANYGGIAAAGPFVFYVDMNEGGIIYRMRVDGSDRTILSRETNSSYLNVAGEWLYFLAGVTGDYEASVFRVPLTGGSAEMIAGGDYGYLVISDGWLYTVELTATGKTMNRMQPDGTGKELITTGESEWLNISGGWIYYYCWEDLYLYKIRTDGTGRTLLTTSDAECAILDGDWIYFRNYDDSYRIYRIRTDGTGEAMVSTEEVFSFNIDDGWIYYASRDDDNIYKMRTNGSDVTLLAEADGFEVFTAGPWVYYLDYDDFAIHRVPKNGGSSEIVGSR